jgi:hypothetical protein
VDALFDATDAVRAQVRGYVAQFLADADANGTDAVKLMKQSPKLLIKIASLDSYGSGVIGLCSTGNTYRILTLDPDYFKPSQDPVQNQLLVSHELGHCVLYRDHRSGVDLIPDGSGHTHEVSIMNPIIIGSAQYNFHKPYYNGELFEQFDQAGGPHVYVCPGKK